MVVDDGSGVRGRLCIREGDAMSGWTPEEKVEAKDKRRGVVEQKPGKGKSKRDTPITVYYRHKKGLLGLAWLKDPRWRKLGAYRSMTVAQQAMDNYLHKYPDWGTDFRIIDRREE